MGKSSILLSVSFFIIVLFDSMYDNIEKKKENEAWLYET